MNFCPVCGAALGKRFVGGRQRNACALPTCGFVRWNNPVPVAAAIVEADGEVVLVRNKGWPEKMFGLVTGFIEEGEAPHVAALREVKEELGLSSEIANLVGAYAFEQANQLIVAYHVPAAGSITLGEELAEAKRVAIHKLKPWPFGTGPAVRDWLSRGTV
jgi:NAD+ diphosphatase